MLKCNVDASNSKKVVFFKESCVLCSCAKSVASVNSSLNHGIK